LKLFVDIPAWQKGGTKWFHIGVVYEEYNDPLPKADS